MELIEKIKEIQSLRREDTANRINRRVWKFTIPIPRRKRWWEFWKKDDRKKALAELMMRYKERIEKF